MAELQRPANVHFTTEGSQALAERVVKSIQDTLKKPAPPAAKWRMVYPTWPKELAHYEKVVCAQYGDRKVTLDLYHPKAAGKYPGVLIIHGGGWYKGDIMSDKGLAERIALAGFVVAQLDYRLSGEAPYPAALHDCKAAIRFLRAHAAEYSLDTDHIGVIGGSAGGHLSGLTALTTGEKNLEGPGGNAEQSSDVQACIVMASTMDLVAAYGEKSGESVVKFLGGTGKERPDVYREASPIVHVTAKSPPTIFIEGEKDSAKIGRPEMQEKLRSFGIETSLHTLKDAPHPFWMSQPWLDQTSHIAIEFFTRNLKPQHP
ncbi:MAG: alpha/beta hydrolase [Verrucomicrobiales bacterium]|nr:alpha/beta hydrolase [Verrucomicrobiales bacterium]